MSMDLYRQSIATILENQHPSGAYVACPNFPTYRYCWFRDGSFCAYAMDLAGEHASAERFHDWAARAILRRAGTIRRALEKAARGEPLPEADVLHTRYTLDGEDGTQQEWTNFQLDGFGTWLWALGEHQARSGRPLPDAWRQAAGLVAAYLSGLWSKPNYDCWEEFGEHVHAHTLAAIYAGLNTYARLAASDPAQGDPALLLAQIRAYIEEHFVYDGHFVKFPGKPEVDASLLGLAVPYGVFALDDPRVLATVAEIERTLRPAGSGVHRYTADTYYGGGEWVLLTAWLGWYRANLAALQPPAGAAASRAAARGLLAWVEAQVQPLGLPEQVPNGLLNQPAYHPVWVERWGPVATPLLWSHAKYIILYQALAEK